MHDTRGTLPKLTTLRAAARAARALPAARARARQQTLTCAAQVSYAPSGALAKDTAMFKGVELKVSTAAASAGVATGGVA